MFPSTRYKIFNVFNHLILTVLSLLCILPLIHILAVSFSSRHYATANLITLWPLGFTLESYEKTLTNPNFTQALWFSVERTVLGTIVQMLLICLTAYALSKESNVFRGRNVYSWIFIFTMLFSGGLIPGYILIQKLHMLNTIWALILPGAVAVYSMILMINFFRSIPRELEEAAKIDGAGHFRVLFTIFIPVSMPAIATLTLFSLVGHWNSWFDGLIYMTDYKKYPLATFLQTVVATVDPTRLNMNPEDLQNFSERTIKAAQIFIGALPILLVYPFLQKFFVKGIILGSVKE